MSDLLKILTKLGIQEGGKPGLTSADISEQTGLAAKKVQDLLKQGVKAGRLEPVKWIDQNHWSGKPRQLVCWRAKK